MDKNVWELLKNSIYASALGDSLGYLVEFQSIDEIKRKYGENGLILNSSIAQNGLFCSDDTQMSLFLLNALVDLGKNIKNIKVFKEKTYESYKDWYFTQMENFDSSNNQSLLKFESLFNRRAPGNTCLSALSLDKFGTMAFRINDSKGAGGLMRTLPIGFFTESTDEAFNLGSVQAALTHGHELGFLSAGFYSAMIFSMVHLNMNMADSINNAENELLKYDNSMGLVEKINQVKWILKDIPGLEGKSLNYHFGEGWVAEEALMIAIYVAETSSSLEEVLRKSINHNGDSDTTGCLAAPLWYLNNKKNGNDILSYKGKLDLVEVIDFILNKIQIEESY